MENTKETPELHPALVANIWKAGDPSPNPNGRPKGAKNRQTIVKEILELQHETGQTYEYVATKAVADKATAGDVTAWDKLMDSAYGKLTDKVDNLNMNVAKDELPEDDKKLFEKWVERRMKAQDV